jgi:hypothetical protein
MTAAVKFDNFINDLVNGVHKNGINTGSPTDDWSIYLTNTTPNVATHTVKGDLAEITQTGGYVGSQPIVLGRSQASGVITLTAGASAVFTGGAGSPSFPSFRYAILFNNTSISPLKPLIVSWDYGQTANLSESQTFTVSFTNGALATVQ